MSTQGYSNVKSWKALRIINSFRKPRGYDSKFLGSYLGANRSAFLIFLKLQLCCYFKLAGFESLISLIEYNSCISSTNVVYLFLLKWGRPPIPYVQLLQIFNLLIINNICAVLITLNNTEKHNDTLCAAL